MSVVVTLNRCMYAQLEQQEFEAPVGFSMPPAMSAQHSAAQRGMKLTCGFEMLSARRSASEVRSHLIALWIGSLLACDPVLKGLYSRTEYTL